jgi:acyl-homoserine-lactone acylase
MIRGLALAAFVALVAVLGSVHPALAAYESVTIVRDAHGEPHIRAASARGAAYGFAYAQMEDQALEVLTGIYRGLGRQAEVLGPDCMPNCFVQDQLTRLFRVPDSANEKFATLPLDTRQRLQAFADGINAYIDDHPDSVPAWASHVTPEAVLANVEWRFVLAQVSRSVDAMPAQGTPNPTSFAQAADDPDIIPDLGASNAFVLAGSKTATGKPILEGDPHLPFTSATQWYGAQLSYPGTSVEGVTFRGLPMIAMGTNGYIAWTNTSNTASLHEQDIYHETLNPLNPNQYLYDGGYRDMTISTALIGVQAQPGVVTPVAVTFRYTHHGPVLSDPISSAADGQPDPPSQEEAYTAKISQYEQVELATQAWEQNEARSIDEMKQALRRGQLSQYNTLAADRDGNIFYVGSSRSGMLNSGLDYTKALDGSDPYTEWQGILPFDQLPQAENPPSGYYQNANNAPWFSAPDQIQMQDLPYYLRRGSNGTRSRRQINLLNAASNLTLEDVERLGMDNYIEFAPSLKALLSQAAADAGADPKVQAGSLILESWGNRASVDSTAYPLFATWVRGLNETALGFSKENPPSLSTTFTSAQKTEARRAMLAAYNGMVNNYGSPEVRYGDLHTITWGSFTAPVSGGDDDVPALRMTGCKAGTPSATFYKLCSVKSGSSYMMNVDMESGRFTVSRPVSDSDDPSSEHYTDNTQIYVADQYRAFPVTDYEVNAEETAREVLTTNIEIVADLVLSQTDEPDPVSVGGVLTYTIDIANGGPSSAGGVTLTDLLPRSARLRSARSDHGRCVQRTPRRVDCNLAGFEASESASVTIVVRPTRAGTIVNTARVDPSESIDPNPANNAAVATTEVMR